MGKLTAYMLLALLWTIQVALADAPVIWYGATAKWLPAGLHSAGLCKTDVNGVFTVGASGTDYAPPTSGSAILKGNGSGGFSSAVSSTDYAPATSGSSILKGNGSGGFSSAVSSTDYAPPTTGSALLKGNGSGGFSNAASGTDYAPATSGSSVLKGNGSGGFSNAASGTDFAPATSGSSLLKGSGSGGFSNAVAGTDYQVPITAGDGTTSGGTFTLGTSGVSAAAYTNANITVDAKGRVTAASNGTGAAAMAVLTKTASYTVLTGDFSGFRLLLEVNASAPATITLPAASNSGYEINIINIGTATATIATAGSDTFGSTADTTWTLIPGGSPQASNTFVANGGTRWAGF